MPFAIRDFRQVGMGEMQQFHHRNKVCMVPKSIFFFLKDNVGFLKGFRKWVCFWRFPENGAHG